MPDLGIHWYTGITGSGKTTLAWQHLIALVTRTRAPALILDHAAMNFLHIPHAKTVDEALYSIYVLRQHTWYSPRGVDDFNSVLRGVIAASEKYGDKIHLLIDEARTYANNKYLSPILSDYMGRWRHLALSIQLTTQYFGDINSEAYSKGPPRLWIFRSTGDRVLELLRQRFSLDPERVSTIPQFQYIEVYEGFR